MKRILPLVVFILLSAGAQAQLILPDLIYTKSNQVIQGKVEEVSDSLIKYRKLDNLNGPIYTLKTSRLVKIEYSNGYVEVYGEKEGTPQPGLEEKNASIEAANAIISDKLKAQSPSLYTESGDSIAVTAETPSPGRKMDRYYPRVVVGGAAEFSQILTGILDEKEPVDYGRGYGGLLRIQYNVFENFGLRLSGGYSQWVKGSDEQAGQVTENMLETIPVLAGAKYYLGRYFYLLGDAGLVLQKTSARVFYAEREDNVWLGTASDFKAAPCVSLSMGAEVKLKKLVFDVGPYVQWHASDAYDYGMYYAGVKLGIGVGLSKFKEAL